MTSPPTGPDWAVSARPLLGIGQVRHARLRPVEHRFAYPTWFLLLPMRSWRAEPASAVARNRFAWVSFHDADHGDGRADSLAWLDEVLAREGVDDADGEVWLHCYPRVLGFAFKPVSFWYCHRHDGTLAAVLVEVNNTFGERHCYLLRGSDLAFGREARAAKAMHVSPFCSVSGDYRFRFMRNDLHPQDDLPRTGSPRTVARIDHHDADGLLLQTSVSGKLVPASARQLRSALLSMPLLMLGVVARIHWQALRLACKRVPFLKKPAPPRALVSR